MRATMAFVTCALAAGALLAFRPASPQAASVTIAGIPAPESFVRIQPGASLVVPANARFVITGVGASENCLLNAYVLFDGQQVLDVRLCDSAESRALVAMPAGMVADAGTVVTCSGVLLGFLSRNSEQPTISVKGIPAPAQMLRVVEGHPLVVPPGTRFVATGFGTVQGERTADLLFGGQLVLRARLDNTTGHIVPIPAGIAATEGTLVEAHDNLPADGAVILGYLAPQ